MENVLMFDDFKLRHARTVGEFVKIYRSVHNLSQGDLALKMKITRGRVAQIENERSDVPIEFCQGFSEHLTKGEGKELRRVLLEVFTQKLERMGL